ncbi:MAG: ABC transporter ATP-binding protein [Clostridiales bacterium]|nr:ABC transporter ATP-binding protein [Clostridiales bacterium]
MTQLLRINNLIVSFENPTGELVAVKGVSLDLAEGETLALVGESGCGKTVLCKSMLHILCEKGRVKQGEILLKDEELTSLTEEEIIPFRGGRIAMVFQDPMTVLDPAFSVGEQIAEVVRIHGTNGTVGNGFRNPGSSQAAEAKRKSLKLMELVGIPEAALRYEQRPYQFSGGMRQRIAIAIALAGNPELLLADEPTTALDEETQREILELLKDVQRKTGVAILFITHDLSLVEGMAQRVAIMKDGRLVEEGPVEAVFSAPKDEYTKKLLGYLDYKKGMGHNHRKENHGQSSLLKVRGLTKSYPLDKGVNRVLEGFDLEIYKGEILGLVGKSGCGKSTLSRCIAGLETPDSGIVELAAGVKMQMIFQDSQSVFNDRMTVEGIIAEPLRIDHRKNRSRRSRNQLKEKVLEAMKDARLDESLAGRKPYELSGGQRQRVAIARALITEPDFIIADEPLTGLDISSQAQIVHLLKQLAEERGLTILFMAHDLPMVNHISSRVINM